jgi:hypothetical protein
MQTLSPQTILPLVYLIQDHTDVNTYYVRAVVKDSRTGTVLKTIDLTDNGDRRFTGLYSVPAAEDQYIDIKTTVYSDSGYTTIAQDKYEEITQYLVKTQWGLQFGGAGGGVRMSVDYEKIKKMIDDAVSGIEKVEKIDLTPIFSKLETLQLCVNDIEMPNMADAKPDPVNLSPIISKLDILSQKVEKIIDKPDIEIPEAEKFDYEKILIVLSDMKTSILDSIKNVEDNTAQRKANISDVVPKIRTSMDEITKLLNDSGIALPKVDTKPAISSRISNLIGKR